MKFIVSAFILSMLAVASAKGESPPPPETNRFPELISGVRISGPLDFCGEVVPLDHQDVRERLEGLTICCDNRLHVRFLD